MTKVTCELCPLMCSLGPSELGRCRVRRNEGGAVRLTTYGLVTTAIVGPIEQKGLYHFHPGTQVLSLGGSGCNMFCDYCQNFEISQTGSAKGVRLSPDEAVAMAKEHGAGGIAFTYSEPIVWFEYVVDVASAARKAGLRTVLKTNGFANEPYWSEMCALMDAINVDVKGDGRFYEEVCGVEMPTPFEEWAIFRNLKTASKHAHLEVSVMLAPRNDLEKLFMVIHRTLGDAELPVHLLMLVPDFRMRNVTPPSQRDMDDALRLAEPFFTHRYADYAGRDAHTKCACGQTLIERRGVRTTSIKAVRRPDGGHGCPNCGAKVRLEA